MSFCVRLCRSQFCFLVFYLADTVKGAQPPLCYKSYAASKFEADFGSIGCPSPCAFENSCQGTQSIQCVTAQDCPILQQGGRAVPATSSGNESGEMTNQTSSHASSKCVGCNIIGCKRCNLQGTGCEECEARFMHDSRSKCVLKSNFFWYAIISLVAASGVWLIVDFIRAHRQSCANPAALRAGLQHRFRMKVRQQTEGHPFYSLTTPLHRRPIVGIDLALFMNWFGLVGFLALYLMILAFVFQPDFVAKGVEDLCVQIDGAMESRRLSEGDGYSLAASYKPLYVPNVKLWTGLSYVGCVLFSMIFLVWQQYHQEHLVESDLLPSTLHEYAVELQGLPADAIDGDEILEFIIEVLRDMLGDISEGSLISASICYDFRDQRDVIEALIDLHLVEQEKQHAEMLERHDRGTVLVGMQLSSRSLKNNDAVARCLTVWEKKLLSEITDDVVVEVRSAPLWVQAISYIMLGTDLDLGCWRLRGHSVSTSAEKPSLEDSASLLPQLECAGSAVVTLRTTALRRVLAIAPTLPRKFRGKHIIRAMPLSEGPESVQWSSFTRKPRAKFRIVFSILMVLGVLFLWTLFYIPWAAFTQSAFDDTSYAAFIANSLLGCAIALGNAMVAYTVCFLTTYLGFERQSTKRIIQLLIIIPCVLINVTCDLAVIARTAYFKYNKVLPDTIEVQLNYGLMLIESDVLALLIPGYCILPYICEPFFTVLLPLWVGIWRVKTDMDITPEQAERMLMAPEIDIINPPLCDIVVITATFFATFMAPGRSHAFIFAGLFAFAAVTFAVNHVRILRWQSATLYSSWVLNRCEAYLWGLPLAVLAAAFGHNFGESLSEKFGLASFSFLCHLTMHILFVRYVLSETSDQLGAHRPLDTTPYEERAASVVADYRNTNPIEVLKSNLPNREVRTRSSRILGDHRLVMFQPGREHLQPESSNWYEGIEDCGHVLGINVLDDQSLSRDVAGNAVGGKIQKKCHAELALVQGANDPKSGMAASESLNVLADGTVAVGHSGTLEASGGVKWASMPSPSDGAAMAMSHALDRGTFDAEVGSTFFQTPLVEVLGKRHRDTE